MKAELLAAAEAELFDAVLYYNQQSEGLGYEFVAEVKQTLGRILRFPDAWHRLSERTRRCRTNRFPYGVVYQRRGDLVLVVAVMHLSRNPDSWKARLDPGER
jgi:plasmid stabilization system protein ParE